MSRRRASALPASSSCTFTATIVTSPTFSNASSMVVSLGMLLPLNRHARHAPAFIVLTIVNLIDALADEVQAETALLAAVEDRRRRGLGIERLTGVQERHRN